LAQLLRKETGKILPPLASMKSKREKAWDEVRNPAPWREKTACSTSCCRNQIKRRAKARNTDLKRLPSPCGIRMNARGTRLQIAHFLSYVGFLFYFFLAAVLDGARLSRHGRERFG
jgi:hypothetical protein